MTGVKIRLRPSSLSGRAGSLYFSLVYRSQSAQITTKCKLFPEEWDESRQQVLFGGTYRDKELLAVEQQLQDEFRFLHYIIHSLEKKTRGNYLVKDVVCFFKERIVHWSFFSFMDEQVAELQAARRFGTARNYRCTRQSFSYFLQGQDLSFQELTGEVICEYDQWLKSKEVARNTISFYMRTLRAVCNKATDKFFFPVASIFQNVYTGVDRTRKRAMSETIIVQLLELELSEIPSLQYARDLFLFSFYTRGMAFVDIAYLRKKDVKQGVLTYIRRKTGKVMSIRLEYCMQAIMSRYSVLAIDSGYVFPIISSSNESEAYDQYKNALCTYNKQLKKISSILELSLTSLSSYVARHTWATVARNKNVPLSIISAGMGHDSEATTQIYLASLETSVIDDANLRIISGLYL